MTTRTSTPTVRSTYPATLRRVREVYIIVQQLIRAQDGRPISIRQLMRAANMPFGTVRYYLFILRDHYGYVTWEKDLGRTIRITERYD